MTKAAARAPLVTVTGPTAQPGLLPVSAYTPPAGATVLTVGARGQFATITAAVAAARDGATILVAAGTYTNDFAVVTAKLTMIGVGGMVNMVATLPPPNAKGILTVDNDVTIQNFAFSGCAISDALGGNGAGIRYEGGRMQLYNDSFSHNQNGVLAFPTLPQLAVNTIAIDHCLFSGNGSGTGQTHNIYVGPVDSLSFTNNVSVGAVAGHQLKSRALANSIIGNQFADGDSGSASYEIDLPNGGVGVVANNIIEKGPHAPNSAMIHFGGEGIPYAGSSLAVTGNRFVNDYGAAIGVLNHTVIGVTVNGNSFAGQPMAQLAAGPASGTGNVDAAGAPLADIAAIGALPGGGLVFTDAAPHSVVLSQAGQAVQGGAGLLTVSDPAGHVIAIGGAGGMNFTELEGAGGSSIVTQAGSWNRITLVGQDLLDSRGNDTIVTGAGNVSGSLSGVANVTDGLGDNNWTVTGAATIVGTGGNPVVACGPSGNVTLNGTLGYLELQTNGGKAQVDIRQGGNRIALTVAGGGSDIKVSDGAARIATAAGQAGVTLRLTAGPATVTSLGADTIYAGGAPATVIVSGHATVYAGSGALALYGRSNTQGATLYGAGGTYLIDGDTGNITYYGQARPSTVLLRLSNNTLVGGAGRMTIRGGSHETIVGGKGGIVYTATDGGGGNSIGTAAGSTNTLLLAQANTVVSRGVDSISGGVGNQSITVYGTATLAGSSGNSALVVYGAATLAGVGQDSCVVRPGGALTLTAGQLASVRETGGTVTFTVPAGAATGATKPKGGLGAIGAGAAGSVTVRGGAATIWGGVGAAPTVTTDAGAATDVAIGPGAATVISGGADTIHAGAGSSTVTVTAANTQIWGGAGPLTVRNLDPTAGDLLTLQGGDGAIVYDQGPGALRFLGGAGSATIEGGTGSLQVTGGAGPLSISGGAAGLQFVGGAGSATIALTPGGGDLVLGAGQITVQEAGWGLPAVFHCRAGAGGGAATIAGFRPGIDQLSLEGVAVAARQIVGGSLNLTLSDATHLTLLGVTDLAGALAGAGGTRL